MKAGKNRRETDAGSGLVLESKDGSAMVRVLSESGGPCSGSCAGCSGGCQGGLFGEGESGRVIRVENALNAAPGDMVALASRAGVRFSALSLLFVMPLVCFLLGFILGTELSAGSDAVALLAAFGGAGLWYGGLSLVQRLRGQDQQVWIARILMPAKREDGKQG